MGSGSHGDLGVAAALAMSPWIVGARTADLLGGALFLGFVVFQFVANAVLSSE